MPRARPRRKAKPRRPRRRRRRQPGAERGRRIRDAVEASLSDIILLGTEEQVRLASARRARLVARHPIHTHELVVSLRLHPQGARPRPHPRRSRHSDAGPTRPASSGGGRGRGGEGGEGRGQRGGRVLPVVAAVAWAAAPVGPAAAWEWGWAAGRRPFSRCRQTALSGRPALGKSTRVTRRRAQTFLTFVARCNR